jgi:hypothetical protein
MLEKRVLSKKVEDWQGSSNFETWQRRQPKPVQISHNQFAEHRRKVARKITDQQNYAPHIQN